MLLIGDLAINKLVEIEKIENIEIVYLSEHEDYIKNYFDIKTTPKKLNNYTDIYQLDSFIYITLYRANELPCYRNLLEDEFATGCKFKMAGPLTLYKKLFITTRLLHIDYKKWVKYTKVFKKISTDYIHPRIHHDRFMLKKLEIDASKLFIPLQYSKDIMADYDNIERWKYYEEESIHNIFEQQEHYNYLDVCEKHTSMDIKNTVWEKLGYVTKISCCIEKINVIASNEFLIKHIKECDELPLKAELKEIFTRSYMIFVNQCSSERLTKFLLFNYARIMQGYDPHFAVILSNALE